MNKLTILEDVLIIGGITVSISTIQSILGIIILCFQIALIIYKCIMKIVEHYKKKQYQAIEEDLQNAIDGLNNINDSIGKKDGNE